jgi:hypothetical protein
MPGRRRDHPGRWASVIASAGLIILAATFALFFIGPVLADSYRDRPDEASKVVDTAIDVASALHDYVFLFLPLACCLLVVTVVAFVVALRAARPTSGTAGGGETTGGLANR